jgi:hypothetical protein
VGGANADLMDQFKLSTSESLSNESAVFAPIDVGILLTGWHLCRNSSFVSFYPQPKRELCPLRLSALD